MRELRVGMVGCGMIAGGPVREGRMSLGNHADALRHVEGARLVAAADPEAGRRAAFGKQWAVEALYANAHDMFAREAIDIAVVTTPPSSHEAACRDALAHGVAGILCEKPFTGTAEGARRIVEACRVAGAKIVVNFTRRWDSSHRELAARISAGEIGRVTSVRGTYTGTLRGNGSHFIDTLRMLVPGTWRTEWVSPLRAPADGTEADGTIEAVLRCDHARAFVVPARDAAYFSFEIDLVGTEGRARITFHGNDIRIDRPSPNPLYPGYLFLEEATRLPPGTMASAGVHALSNLAQAVRHGNEPDVRAEEHVASLALLDEIVRHALAHGENES